MVPPGDNLEFYRSEYIKKRLPAKSPLADAIEAAIRGRPVQGQWVVGPARKTEILVGGEPWVVFYSRKGNRIGLMGAFASDEVDEIEGYERGLRELFGLGGGR